MRKFLRPTSVQNYLDAAAWAALGVVDRAADLLRTRLSQQQSGPFMSGLMISLLAVLEGRGEGAVAFMQGAEISHEPEALFYFARHCAMANATAPAIQMLRPRATRRLLVIAHAGAGSCVCCNAKASGVRYGTARIEAPGDRRLSGVPPDSGSHVCTASCFPECPHIGQENACLAHRQVLLP
jgi:hypothetical protein